MASEVNSVEMVRPNTYLPGLHPEAWDGNVVLRVLSLGGGVQSTAIALMAEQGVFGVVPDVAIFADTGAEPQYVYENIDWIRKQVSFPVTVVRNSYGTLTEHVMAGVNHVGNGFAESLPFYSVHGESGKTGILIRQCTNKYKVRIIRREVGRLLVERLGNRGKPTGCVEQWLGISTDEAARMRKSDVRYIYNFYPLIEGVGWSRQDCARWLRENYSEREVKKSSCVFCPFHDDRLWAEMKRERPEDFELACKVDDLARDPKWKPNANMDLKHERFLHDSRIPLREVQFDLTDRLSRWNNECEGLCGV